MAISYFGDKKQYILNHYRVRKLLDGYLVTTDYGSWAYLSPEEYRVLKSEKIEGQLFNVLKDCGIILNKDNISQVIKDYREKCDYLFFGTSLHIVVPTLRCNLKCIYCHAAARGVEEKGYDMDKETARKTVDFIFQSPSKFIMIEFQGGEPLIRFDMIKYIVEYANEKNKKHKKDLNFSVVTNLSLMTDEKFKFFKKHTIGICTSLDGCQEVHDSNRADYKNTVKWIRKIKKNYTVNAMLLVTKASVPYYKEIVDEYYNLGLNRMWIKPVNQLGFAGKNWKKIDVDVDEYLDFWKKSLDYIVKKNKFRLFADNYVRVILQKILTKDCVNFTDLQSPCGAAIGQLAYSYDGNIFSCDEGRLYDLFRLGTVDDKYKDVVASPSACAIVRASINDNPVCETCAYKPLCGLCPVCSYAETGNIISKLPNRRCEILIGMFDYLFEKLISDEEYKKVFFTWVENEII